MQEVLYNGKWMNIRQMRFLRIVNGEIAGTPDECAEAIKYIETKMDSQANKFPKEAKKFLAQKEKMVKNVKISSKYAVSAPKKVSDTSSTEEDQKPLTQPETGSNLAPTSDNIDESSEKQEKEVKIEESEVKTEDTEVKTVKKSTKKNSGKASKKAPKKTTKATNKKK